MKNSTIIPNFIIYIAVICLVATQFGCNQKKRDKEIKADIMTKTKTDLNFAGVSYTVEGGVVTLTGNCPTGKSRSEAEKTIKTINVIKGLNNQIVVAPVLLNADLGLKQQVDSVLAAYPAVQGIVSNRIVTLTGRMLRQESGKLMPAINQLGAARIDNQLFLE